MHTISHSESHPPWPHAFLPITYKPFFLNASKHRCTHMRLHKSSPIALPAASYLLKIKFEHSYRPNWSRKGPYKGICTRICTQILVTKHTLLTDYKHAYTLPQKQLLHVLTYATPHTNARIVVYCFTITFIHTLQNEIMHPFTKKHTLMHVRK